MRKRFILALGLCLGLVFFFSCGREAKKAIDEAQLALKQAKEAGAEQYAPQEYQSAEGLLSQARQQFEERDYQEAKATALSAKDQAELAKKRALERKTQTEEEEEEVSTAYNVPSLTEEVPIEEQAKAALKDIHFGFDRYDLTEQAKRILEENAKWLKAHPEVKVVIEGHCDERGSEEYNLALGEKRAKSARDYLISLGISPEHLSIISYGESMPLDPRHCEEAWAKNRRAHFAIKK